MAVRFFLRSAERVACVPDAPVAAGAAACRHGEQDQGRAMTHGHRVEQSNLCVGAGRQGGQQILNLAACRSSIGKRTRTPRWAASRS